MAFAAIWIVLGLALGFGIAFAIRRFLPAWRIRRRVAPPPVYASRQEERKAMRERQKKKPLARKRN
jgi:hypothetical protein